LIGINRDQKRLASPLASFVNVNRRVSGRFFRGIPHPHLLGDRHLTLSLSHAFHDSVPFCPQLQLHAIALYCTSMVAPRKTRVVVGMSGGVDSSATAALLLEQGYDVVGITLKLWPQDCVSRAEDKCCGPQAVTDARAVCHKLGIPYYLVDEAAEFQKHVIQYFADEYKAGRTPNPEKKFPETIKPSVQTASCRPRKLRRSKTGQ